MAEEHKKEDSEEEFVLSMKKLQKIKWNIIILAAIIIIGFIGLSFLPVNSWKTPGRIYHLDFPSIGYHNMKENEYLSQAANMPRYHDYLRRIMHIYGMDDGPGYFEEYPQMPMVPWLFLISWSIFGIKFWAARIIIVLFSVASIPLIYLTTKKLTKDNEYISLLSAFLFAIMPLAVFFGRNIQPESPALFALLLGMYFYLKWINDRKTKTMIYSGLALCLCAIFKPTFLIGIIPMLAVFPYKEFLTEIKDKKQKIIWLKQAVFFALCFLPFILWNFVISAMFNTRQAVLSGILPRVQLTRIFGNAYWAEYYPTIKAYVNDNYAVWFFIFMILGLIIVAFKYKTTLSKFLWAYAIAVIPYMMLVADYFKAHSYYQMPFLPLVCIAGAYFIYTVGMIIKQITRIKGIQYIALLILFLTLPSVKSYTGRQFDTIFFGLDVAGQYIKEHSNPNDKFFFEGHSQSLAICYNSDRRCDAAINLSMMLYGEENKNFKFYFLHGDLGLYNLYQKKEIFDHVQKNYRLVQVGLIRVGDQWRRPDTYVLEKGGTSDLVNIQNNPIFSKAPRLAKTYDTTYGKIDYYILEE